MELLHAGEIPGDLFIVAAGLTDPGIVSHQFMRDQEKGRPGAAFELETRGAPMALTWYDFR